MRRDEASWDEMRQSFDWALPARLNMAHEVCDLWAGRDPSRVALIDAAHGPLSYGRLRAMADGLAAHLAAHGVARGDRVGVLRSQDAWTAAAHIAIWKLGAVSIPLFKLFQHAALASRLSDAGAAFVVTDAGGAGMLAGLAVTTVVPEAAGPLDTTLVDPVQTGPEDPAVLIYTSGTTGAPKGALHGHRMLAGHLPGVRLSHDFLGQPEDVLWTPADWAWIGGLFDVLMPGLALGVPVVAARPDKFTADWAVDLIARHKVRNVFFPPTALKMLKAADVTIPGLRSVASGGEPLGAEMLAWGQEALGVTINEFYGQTECNMVATSCAASFPPRPGCIGRAVPGFEIGVIDGAGNPAAGEGDIAIRRGAASMMLGYWNKPEATAEKFRGDWMLSGDRGVWEGDYLRFVAREDDVITSAGYRIGPSEIEDCLITHPAVAQVGVVGRPDPLRTERVVAFVVLREGVTGEAALAQELQDWVRTRLAQHSYPRDVVFLEALPMTVTGKVIRRALRALALDDEGVA